MGKSFLLSDRELERDVCGNAFELGFEARPPISSESIRGIADRVTSSLETTSRGVISATVIREGADSIGFVLARHIDDIRRLPFANTVSIEQVADRIAGCLDPA